MKLSRFVHACALCAAFAGCGRESGPEDQWPISRRELEGKRAPTAGAGGEATYQRFCIGCHGADGRGNGGTTGADFTGPESPLLSRTDAELRVSVRDGKTGTTATMPAHSPVLSEAQIAEVVGYVRSRFQK